MKFLISIIFSSCFFIVSAQELPIDFERKLLNHGIEQPFNIILYNDLYYFKATDIEKSIGDNEYIDLYSYNDNTDTLRYLTHIITLNDIDIYEGNSPPIPDYAAIFANKLFFTSFNNSLYQLNSYDSDNDNLTLNIKNNNQVEVLADPNYFKVVDERLYFIASDINYSKTIFYIDSETSNSVISTITASHQLSQEMFLHKNELYSLGGQYLYKYDKISNTFLMVFELPVTPFSWEYKIISDILYFSAYDDELGRELYSYDFSSNNIELVNDINQGSGNSNPQNFYVYKDTLFFTAVDLNTGYELFIYNPETKATSLIADIFPGDVGSHPYSFIEYEEKLYFKVKYSLNSYFYVYDDINSEVIALDDFSDDIKNLVPSPQSNPIFHSNKLFWLFDNILSVDINSPSITQGEKITVEMDEDNSPNSFALLLNATALNADELTWTLLKEPSRGIVSFPKNEQNPAVNYTPDENYHGSDIFILQVADSEGETDSIEVSIVVNSVNDEPTGEVLISGEMLVGSTLNVDNNLSDVDGLGEFNYNWFRDEEQISNANNDNYVLTQDDVDHHISATISYVDNDGAPEKVTSTQTEKITSSLIETPPVIKEDDSSNKSGGSFWSMLLILAFIVHKRKIMTL